jgi:hypothetical protein
LIRGGHSDRNEERLGIILCSETNWVVREVAKIVIIRWIDLVIAVDWDFGVEKRAKICD